MDYEKLHKDTIAKLQEMVNSGKITVKTACGICADFVPESEDERIKKAIRYAIGQSTHSDGTLINGVSSEEALSWIKKQSEQSSLQTNERAKEISPFMRSGFENESNDKVEPKFREGDMIIHKELGGDYIHSPHKIIQVDILDKKYRLEGGLVAHFGEQDDYELVEQKHVWSEEDETILANLIYALANDRISNNRDEYVDWFKSLKERYTWKPSDLPHWQKSNLPNNNTTGFNSDYFCHKGYCINYKELFEKLPKDD